MTSAAARELSREQARRIAVRAQLLDAERPVGLIETVQRLGVLQNDPTNAVARNADLVLWSRLGSGYGHDELQAALDGRALIEISLMIRPAEDVALVRAEMVARRDPTRLDGWQRSIHDWVVANDACRTDVLRRLEAEGPLVAGEIPDTCVVPWKSTGWTNDRNVNQMLDAMVSRGEVATPGRRGNERLWDLAERVYPDDPIPPLDVARRTRAELRLRALGIAREKATAVPGEPNHVGPVGVAVTVADVRGRWRVDAAELERVDDPFDGRTALLSPLDHLVFDRKRMAELFDYEYALEMYKPVAKRRWGYWALPILHGTELVGKLDAFADRKAGVLRINAVHPDTEMTPALEAAVTGEIRDLADWLDLPLDDDADDPAFAQVPQNVR
jgi:uncharacterized protein YcaQ